MKNPFNYLQFATGDNFYDRKEILADLRSRLMSGATNVVLYGPRRYGKSSLVSQLVLELEEAGVPCVVFDVMKVPSIDLFVSSYATKVYRKFAPVKFEFRKIGEFLKNLRLRLTIGADGETGLSIDTAQSKIGSEELTEILDLPQRIISKNRRAVIVMDEFQEVSELLPNDQFERVMRSVIQSHENISYIFLGSRYHMLRRMFTERNRPFYKSAIAMMLDKPPFDESIDFVVSRFASGGVAVSREVAAQIVLKIDNIPYSTVLDGGIGYIILSQFTKDAAKELKDTFLKMKAENELKGLIIDLRGNGGGLLNEAVDIVNIFTPKNKLVVYTKGKTSEQNRNYFTKNEPEDTEIPLVVLVNEASASASEIVAGSIQDFDRGVIVGQRTFGKGLVQNILPMTYNTQMKVTVSKYYIPSKRCIQEIDYSKKSKNDTISKNDTLGPVFRTANGRKVYEGHGIQPDVKIESDLLSTVTAHLYADNLIFKFANKFYRENKFIASPETFEITDEIYDDFVKFVGEQEFSYVSESEKDFDELVKTAKMEGYYDKIKEQLDLLEHELKNHKGDDMNINRDEIEELLKMEIVGRYYFQKGKIISTLKDDKELERAVEILLNTNGKNEYENLLKGTN